MAHSKHSPWFARLTRAIGQHSTSSRASLDELKASSTVPLTTTTADELPLHPSGQTPTAACAVQDPDTTDTFGSSSGEGSDTSRNVAFALDCSGSTSGRKLEAEKSAIQDISAALSRVGPRESVILPWNHQAGKARTFAKLDEVISGGGTRPSVLTADPTFKTELHKASVWCLLTDGEIHESEVQQFATGIGLIGLHGTAAIIILAGSLTKSPLNCNISVGKAVYAVTADCAFLFHDIGSAKVYIMQAKGCFTDLLPPLYDGVVLDESTTWADLPQISYEKLASIIIPEPRKLAKDVVLLSSGKTFNLNLLFENRVPEELTVELLGNNQDLGMLVMAGSTHNRRGEVQTWISARSISTANPIWKPRPDPEGKCLQATRAIVHALRDGSGQDLGPLRRSLLSLRTESWSLLGSALLAEQETVQERDTIISDVTARLRLDASMPSSSAHLSPVSRRLHGMSSSRQQQNNVTVSSSPPAQAVREEPNEAQRRSVCISLLYTQGYRLLQQQQHFDVRCPICDSDGVAALLLKQGLPWDETAEHKEMYHMLQETYPDTDVLIPELCCEACATFLLADGQSCNGEDICGILPLVSLDDKDGFNRAQYKKTIGNAFKGRFDDTTVLQVFRSVLEHTTWRLTALNIMKYAAVLDAMSFCRQHVRHAI